MQDESKMYELEYPAPKVDFDSANGPVLIVALQGFADAGMAVDNSANHLKAALDSRPVVSFNNDELIDYRSRRPTVTLDDNSITDIEALTLDLRVLRDTEGTSFLLLSGPEPDMRWEAFTGAVADLAEKYNVGSTVCLYGAPMTVPHTRPLVVSAHGNSRELVGDLFQLHSQVTMPGSASLFLEREMHKRGGNVAGYTAHVPHYIAQGPYPQATYQLLQAVSSTTGLKFPLRSLEHDIERSSKQLENYLSDNTEVVQVVHALEEQYDAEVERYRNAHPGAMLPGEGPLPTGDEIGEEFERFLASIDDDASRGTGGTGGTAGTNRGQRAIESDETRQSNDEDEGDQGDSSDED